MATFSLNIDNRKVIDIGVIDIDQATLADKNGYVLVNLNSFNATVIDKPEDETVTGDGQALFSAVTKRHFIGFGQQNRMAHHPVSKVSGMKTYNDNKFVFAVNRGKVDGNGTVFKASANRAHLVECTLQKVQNWPCDDHVNATVDYTVSFVDVEA